MKVYLLATIFLFIALSGSSQEIGYEIFGTQTNPHVGPYPLVTLDTLSEAKTLADIHARYRASWVADYRSVTIATVCNDEVKSAAGPNATLTRAQMDILRAATTDCRIEVEVDYIPANTLRDNPPRKMKFSLTPIPIFEAKFPGGNEHLNAYLEQNIVDQISEETKCQIELAKIKFSLSTTGQVLDVQIFKTSGDPKVDQLILNAFCNMPRWQPAENAAGEKFAQEFEFNMGTALLRCDYPF